ncbi:MAG: orotate phosphoribosyltransferase [Acidobacteriota bacterium]|nr:orotate phosphoribosyltransferase [Acidobacteriota bacterium]
MTETEILEHFRATGALLEGHFQLSSGLHSPQYLQCALALRHPRDAARFGYAIAERFAEQKFDAVISPAIGGLIIGFVVAQSLGVPFFWTERENGAMTVRRGFSVGENEKLLVVEDVITTGGSTRECIAAVEKLGGQVVAAASIVDRSGGAANVGVPRAALATLNVPTFQPENCPMCARGETAVKPGSRVRGK